MPLLVNMSKLILQPSPFLSDSCRSKTAHKYRVTCGKIFFRPTPTWLGRPSLWRASMTKCRVFWRQCSVRTRDEEDFRERFNVFRALRREHSLCQYLRPRHDMLCVSVSLYLWASKEHFERGHGFFKGDSLHPIKYFLCSPFNTTPKIFYWLFLARIDTTHHFIIA